MCQTLFLFFSDQILSMSLEIYNAVSTGEFETALMLSVVLGAVSSCIMLTLKRLGAF